MPPLHLRRGGCAQQAQRTRGTGAPPQGSKGPRPIVPDAVSYDRRGVNIGQATGGQKEKK